MEEITIMARGGQGAVTASQILAKAAFKDGFFAQTFPKFGAERRGAPVMAYVRIDKEPISTRSKIYTPNVVEEPIIGDGIASSATRTEDGNIIIDIPKEIQKKLK